MSTLEKTKISFGTSGWRGIISDDFTAENVAIVAQAIANHLKKIGESKNLVIVGYDTRFMSDRFAAICANVLKSNGVQVLMTERDTPTPVIAFQLLKKGAVGAINITASHNPPEYNGIKFNSSYGGPAPAEVTKDIENEIKKIQEHNIIVNYTADKEDVPQFNPQPEYVRKIAGMIDLASIKKSKIKIVIDCLYGTSRGYLDFILEKAGIKPMVMNNYVNPNFGGSSPSPAVECLRDMKKVLLSNRAHIGLATDGDADRFGIMDRDGTFITPNYVLPLIFEHLLKTRKHKGGIVRSITTTHLMDAIAKKYNREVYEVPVGFKYVGTALTENNALMGCEESGGMTIFGHIPEKDGPLACLLMTELVACSKKPISTLLKELENNYGKFFSDRLDIHLKQEDKERLLNNLKNNSLKNFAGINVAKYEVLPADNVKIDLVDGGWVMIRPSGTEPIIRGYLETTSAKKFSAMKKALKELFV